MKHCQQCNLDFPGSYRFCGSCGGALSDSSRCPGCGELTEGRWSFCTNCGSQLLSGSKGDRALPSDVPELAGTSAGPPSSFSTPVTSPSLTETTHAFEQQSKNAALQEWYAAPDLLDETTQTPATPMLRQELAPKTTVAAPRVTAHPQAGNGKAPPTLTMLAAYGKSETAPPEWQTRHALLLGLLFLVFVGVLGAGGVSWWTHRASAAQSPPQIESTTAPKAADSSSSSSSTSAATTASERSSAVSPADEEWKRLREKRISAKPSESSAVIASLDDAEKKYPRDYRFPYERAKLSIKGIISHHEAFDPLARAAEKAIDNDKAQEMLNSLTADKDGDFYKLSRGHREWQTLAQALTNKDKKALSELHH